MITSTYADLSTLQYSLTLFLLQSTRNSIRFVLARQECVLTLRSECRPTIGLSEIVKKLWSIKQ